MSNEINVAIGDILSEEFARRWKEDLERLPINLRLIEKDTAKDVERALAGAHVVIVKNRTIDAALLTSIGDQLKLVIKLSHWPIGVDLEACEERGIRVKMLPQLGCIAVAEQAMALILACARRIIPSHQGVVAGAYLQLGLTPTVTTERSFAFKWLPVEPFEVYGKALGIIGFGEIGKELAVRANSFGMAVCYYKRSPLPNEIESMLHARYCKLNELLRISDFVSLHIPHTEETDKLLGKNQLIAMKKTAYVINTARGGEIDEEALVWALESGEIAGAGLDVFVEEPVPFDHPLLRLDNVVLSPHIGGGSGTGRTILATALRTLIKEVLDIQ